VRRFEHMEPECVSWENAFKFGETLPNGLDAEKVL
jgi:hypothetical protein